MSDQQFIKELNKAFEAWVNANSKNQRHDAYNAMVALMNERSQGSPKVREKYSAHVDNLLNLHYGAD